MPDGKLQLPGASRPARCLLAEYAILPDEGMPRDNTTLPGGRWIEIDADNASLWLNLDPLPRAWIVRQVEGTPRGTVPFSLRENRDSRQRADESCRLLRYRPHEVEIEAVLHEPGLVVLCDQIYPGWELEVHTDGREARPVEILRTNRVMRGAWLPPGHHRLVYRYRPASFRWGAIISGLGWLGLVVTVAVARIAERRR